MQNQILLTQISLEQLEEIVSNAVTKSISENSFLNQIPNEEPELLTRKQVAKLFSISLPTLSDWTKQGRVRAYKINTRIRFKRAEILGTLNEVQQTKFKRVIY